MLPPLFKTQSVHQPLQAHRGICVRLDFSDLKVFELVRNQYQDLGIQFEGAIALQPSHPAFEVRSVPVLMPAADRSSISVYFSDSRRVVGGWVTSARQVKMTALNADNQILGQQRAGVPQYLLPPPESVERFPEHQLQLRANGITKVEFASDAPFILQIFFCG